MSPIEDLIVTTLRDNAASEVDVADLLATSRRRGQGYRRRRRVWQAGGAAAGALATLVAVALAAPGPARHDEPVGAPAPRSQASAPTSPTTAAMSFRLPRADARPATADPGVVGADPRLLHFDIDPSAAPQPMTLAQWTSMAGLERLTMEAGPPVRVGKGTTVPSIQVEIARDRSALDPLGGPGHTVRIGGRPGTLAGSGTGPARAAQVVWQPVTGVWAQVQAPGDDPAVIAFAEAVTFDHVLRCVVPFRLTWLPAGTALDTCSTVFSQTGASGRATVRTGTGAVTVEVDRGITVVSPGTTVNGLPAKVHRYPGDGGSPVLQVDVQYPDHVVDLLAEGAYDQATVLRIAGGYRDVTDPDPGTWPVDPLR
jgi:hypothetical protein